MIDKDKNGSLTKNELEAFFSNKKDESDTSDFAKNFAELVM